MTVGNVNAVRSLGPLRELLERTMALRPWRTSRLPELVGIKDACEILGVQKMTLTRWMKPGSGKDGISFGPDRTYMITPRRVGSRKLPDGTWTDDGWPVWDREDVERFAREIGRQRAPVGEAKS